MDWINCNSCCRQPGDEKERMFMLSSCGHIFCDLCLAKAESREKCKVCSAHCQFIQLSSKMNPDAELFFQEPSELIRKQSQQINRLLDFQKEHRIRLVSFYRRMFSKYRELERQYKLALERLQHLEKENAHCKEILSSAASARGSSESLIPAGSVTPHNSYQRSINTPGMRYSPQEKMYHHTSPGGTRISPGRLTLLKTKSVSSSPGSPNEALSKGGQAKHHCPSATKTNLVHHHPQLTPVIDPITGMAVFQTELSRTSSPMRTSSNESCHQNNRGPGHQQSIRPPKLNMFHSHFSPQIQGGYRAAGAGTVHSFQHESTGSRTSPGNPQFLISRPQGRGSPTIPNTYYKY